MSVEASSPSGIRLKGRTALIVGASKGLGRAIAAGYAQQGANIIGLSRDLSALENLQRELHPLDVRVDVHTLDVVEPGAYPRLAQWLTDTGLDFDILVHTPGGGLHALGVSDERVRAQIIAGRGQVPFWQIEDRDVDLVLELGLKSPMKCCKYLAPFLMKHDRGSIVVLGSGAGMPGNQGQRGYISVYAAEKGAVLTYVISISHELKDYGIAANILLPGGIMNTPLVQQYPQALRNPALLPPEAVVPAAVYLAEQDASGVTGQTIDAREYAKSQTAIVQ